MLIWNRSDVTLGNIKEDEEDNALLNGLQLDHEAALLDLQETQNSLEDTDSSIAPFSPGKDVEALTEHDRSMATATLGKYTIVDDQFLDELQEEIGSLRSSRTSFYSLSSMSDSASRHSKRLSQSWLKIRSEFLAAGHGIFQRHDQFT